MATSYPARASPDAISLPIPELAPVTSTQGRELMSGNSARDLETPGKRPSLTVHQSHGEPIVTLRAHRLQCGCGKPGIPGHQVEHVTRALDGRILTAGVPDGAIA